MGNKRITEKDFWVCSMGNVPAPMQGTQETTSKKGGERYITIRDTSTSSVIDFGCKKAMLIYAMIAAAAVVIAALVVGTGGAALIALGALAGLAGAAWGAVVGALLCGQTAAKGRKWIAPPKANMTAVQGVQQLTGDCTMSCIVGGTVSFVPDIKSWSQAIALGGANYLSGLMEGMMAGAAIGMGGAAIGGGAGAFAAGGMRGVGQAAWQFARSMPRNLVVNAIESFSKVGLALRGVMGVQNTAAAYGSTGSAGVGDFFEGTVAMETGTIDSFNSIRSGQGAWQDYVGMAMLWAPVGQGKRDLEKGLRNEPDGSGRDGDTGKPDDVGTRRAENVDAETTGKKGDGEAFEDGLPVFDRSNYTKLDSEKLGDFGERVAEDYYRSQGYDEFYAVQNNSGNGVDIVARNSSNGNMVKTEVKTTQQDRLWNNGDTKEIPMSKDQAEMGGEDYTNDRLGRAANEEDGYTDGHSSQQAEAALEAQRDALDSGAEVKTEKMDIYVDSEGSLRGDPKIRTW